jgi:hypothetical protein
MVGGNVFQEQACDHVKQLADLLLLQSRLGSKIRPVVVSVQVEATLLKIPPPGNKHFAVELSSSSSAS